MKAVVVASILALCAGCATHAPRVNASATISELRDAANALAERQSWEKETGHFLRRPSDEP